MISYKKYIREKQYLNNKSLNENMFVYFVPYFMKY